MAIRAEPKLTGSAGEHWVAAVLASQGWSVALTRDGVSRSDILAVDSRPGRERQMIEIQVKTASRVAQTNWRINSKAQSPSRSDREWFALVELPKLGQPESPLVPRTFIAPRDHLSAAAYALHTEWLHDPTATGPRSAGVEQARVDAGQTMLGYENRWDLLDEPATAAPILLPAGLRSVMEREGLPSGHPWTDQLPAW